MFNRFSPIKNIKSNPQSGQLDLHEVLKNSYSNKHRENMNGYKLDKELSSKNQQVYYNPEHKKLVVSVKGTDMMSPRDWGTDFYLGIGKLKDTNRYKEAKSIYDKAKAKYNPMQSTAVGHSLGSSISNYITSGNDKSVGLDGGYTIGQTSRNNSKQYRSSGDVVSALGANASNMTTLKSPNIRTGVGLVDALRSHNVSNIAGQGILI
jgi:tetratricopeptide (TPR) repeat protein